MEQFPREVLCDWKLSRSTFSVAVRREPSALTPISTWRLKWTVAASDPLPCLRSPVVGRFHRFAGVSLVGRHALLLGRRG
jgi:hypothetical protein